MFFVAIRVHDQIVKSIPAVTLLHVPDSKVDPVAGSTAALLHNKVDKVIRVIAETSENQKKMNRVLQDLIKFGGMTRPELG